MVSSEKNSNSVAQKKNDVTTMASGATLSLSGKIGGRVLLSFREIILARWLGPEAYGLFGLGWSILRILETISALGLHNGIIRFGSLFLKKTDKVSQARFKGVLQQSLVTSLIGGLVIGLLLFISAPWLEGFLAKPGLAPVIRLFAVALPFSTLLKVGAAGTRISQRMRFSFIAEDIGAPLLEITLLVIFLSMGWKLIGAVSASVLSFIGMTVLIFYFLSCLFPLIFSKKPRSIFPGGELINYSIQTTMVGMLHLLTHWADRWFIGYFRPAAEVGIYQAISQIPVMFTIILRGINTTFIPMIPDLHHQGEMKRLEELYRVNTKWGLYLSSPIFLTICFAPQSIVFVLFGKEYLGYELPMIILAIGQIANVGTGAVGMLLTMTGNQKWWLLTTNMALLSVIAMHLFLIPRLGVLGAATSTAVGVGGMYIIDLIQVRYILKIWPYDRRYLKLITAIIITIFFLMLLRPDHFPNHIIGLATAATVSSVGIGGSLLLLGFDSEDKEYMQHLLNRIKRLIKSR